MNGTHGASKWKYYDLWTVLFIRSLNHFWSIDIKLLSSYYIDISCLYIYSFFFFFKDKAFLFYKIPSAFWIKDKVSISKYISHISIFICSIRINLIFLNLFCRLKNIHYEINVIETRRYICCWSKIFQKLNKILNEKFENSDNNCHK